MAPSMAPENARIARQRPELASPLAPAPGAECHEERLPSPLLVLPGQDQKLLRQVITQSDVVIMITEAATTSSRPSV